MTTAKAAWQPTASLLILGAFLLAPLELHASRFARGDLNADGRTNLGDSLSLLLSIFTDRAALACQDAADVNDDGTISLSDAIHLLAYIFSRGAPPAAPFPDCGPDPTADSLTCEVFPRCPPETVIVTSAPAPEPHRARLHVWITSRFDPDASIVDLSLGETIPFAHAKRIIYYGISQEPPPQAVRDQLRSWLLEGPDRWLVWIGYAAHSFDFTEWGFQVEPALYTDGPPTLDYVGIGGAVLPFKLTQVHRILATITDPARAEREATWGSEDGKGIFVTGTRGASSGRTLFLGLRVTEGIKNNRTAVHLPFMDLLHGVFPGWGLDDKRMFVRLEDIHADCIFDDPSNLPSVTTAASYLTAQGIPFTLALIPVYLQAEPPVEKHISPLATPLTDAVDVRDPLFRKNIIDLLNLSPESSIVVHGWTHQYGSGTSGDDAEFCVRTGIPPVCERFLGIGEARTRVDRALRELIEAGLTHQAVVGSDRVMGWETPHYQASNEVREQVFENRFSFIFEPGWWETEHPALADEWETLPGMPYTLKHNATVYLGTFHGFIRLRAEAEHVARIIEEAAILSRLRYRVESAFFVHPSYIELPYIEEIIGALKTQGWRFPGLRAIVPTPLRR